MPPGILPLRLTLSTLPPAPSTEQSRSLLQHARRGLLADPAARIHLHGGELPGTLQSERTDTTGMTLCIAAIARHPVQLYEAGVCLTLTVVLFFVWWKQRSGLSRGLLFGWFLVVIFTSRFFLEYFKESVTPNEAGLPLTLGQMLSIPFVLAGLWLLMARGHLHQSSPTTPRNRT